MENFQAMVQGERTQADKGSSLELRRQSRELKKLKVLGICRQNMIRKPMVEMTESFKKKLHRSSKDLLQVFG